MVSWGSIVAMIGFGAFVHETRFRLYSLGTIAILIGFGALAGFLAGPMPEATPWVGLAERINIYATMLWMLAFAASLLCVGGAAAPSKAKAEERESVLIAS